MAGSVTPRSRWAVAAPWVTMVVRVALAVILGYAGLVKIGDTGAAVRAVRAYEILPEGAVQLWAYGQPFAELALALLLLVGLASRLTAIGAAALLVIFIAGIVSAWARGLSIDCGCFGGGGQIDPSQTQYPRKIAEDVGFLALALWVAVFPRSAWSLDRLLLDGGEAVARSGQSGESDEFDEAADHGERSATGRQMIKDHPVN
jgi:uncharacterized membrane protein YphA (DoxX/SURF4 family)